MTKKSYAIITLSMAAILAATYVIIDRQESLENHTSRENSQQPPADSTDKDKTPADGSDQEPSSDGFASFADARLGISFDYPSSWKIGSPYELTGDNFYLTLDTDAEIKPGLAYSLGIAGYKDHYENEMDKPCAIDIEDFCKDGCERLDADTAIDYRITMRGEKGLHAYAFTDLSPFYPVICFDFSLEQIVRDIASRDGIGYYEALDKIQDEDLDLMIEERSVSPLVSRQLDDFKSIILSIKAIR